MIIFIYRALIFCRFGLGLSPQALWCRSRSDDDPKSEPHLMKILKGKFEITDSFDYSFLFTISLEIYNFGLPFHIDISTDLLF